MTILISTSPEQTRQIGYYLGQLLDAGDVICLDGDLGAGKTTFSAGVGEGWGTEHPLTSPTFVIVQQYDRALDRQVLYHLDAYRLDAEGDAESVGLLDIFDANGAVLIEWPEKIRSWLPDDHLWIHFTIDDNDDSRRMLTLQAAGNRSLMLLDALKAKFGD